MHACSMHVSSWFTVDILSRDKPVTNAAVTPRTPSLCSRASVGLAPLLKPSRLIQVSRQARGFTPLVTLVRPRAERMDFRRERERGGSNDWRDCACWCVYDPSTLSPLRWWIARTFRGWNWALRTQEAHIVMNLVLWYISRQAGIYPRDTTGGWGKLNAFEIQRFPRDARVEDTYVEMSASFKIFSCLCFWWLINSSSASVCFIHDNFSIKSVLCKNN